MIFLFFKIMAHAFSVLGFDAEVREATGLPEGKQIVTFQVSK